LKKDCQELFKWQGNISEGPASLSDVLLSDSRLSAEHPELGFVSLLLI